LGGVGLLFVVYTVKSDQYDDPEGNAQRILNGEWDDHPKP
ncbi:MAG: cbb3-type cytochrome oxidase assembly protein CcoS, partial [Thalassovita sp.]|nr:cbb3-type cytochrome oxidase assembly protein CcoS [Thalassovita sp.]